MENSIGNISSNSVQVTVGENLTTTAIQEPALLHHTVTVVEPQRENQALLPRERQRCCGCFSDCALFAIMFFSAISLVPIGEGIKSDNISQEGKITLIVALGISTVISIAAGFIITVRACQQQGGGGRAWHP